MERQFHVGQPVRCDVLLRRDSARLERARRHNGKCTCHIHRCLYVATSVLKGKVRRFSDGRVSKRACFLVNKRLPMANLVQGEDTYSALQ